MPRKKKNSLAEGGRLGDLDLDFPVSMDYYGYMERVPEATRLNIKRRIMNVKLSQSSDMAEFRDLTRFVMAHVAVGEIPLEAAPWMIQFLQVLLSSIIVEGHQGENTTLSMLMADTEITSEKTSKKVIEVQPVAAKP